MKTKSVEFKLSEIDFIQDAGNFYRTKDFIVAQKLDFIYDCKTLILHCCSHDVFYKRTPLRDAQYLYLFSDRKARINGKRVKSTYYIRKYVN